MKALSSMSLLAACFLSACAVGEADLEEHNPAASSAPCSLGEQRPCIANEAVGGACGAGYQSCVELGNGRIGWGACAPAPSGEPEVCDDGIDNNCDGNIDELCARYDIMVGEDGVILVEEGEQGCSLLEVCDNGRDDDCDGGVDEDCYDENGCTLLSIGRCVTACGSQGYRYCDFDQTWAECVSAGEACGNGVDDDCDGLVDEDCCPAGTVVSCVTSCGTPGTQSCDDNGILETVCMPSTEICANATDDDCDGWIDENCDVDEEWPEVNCEDYDFGHCNGDMGYGDQCDAGDNTNGCTDESFNGWCNRRNPETPTLWDDTVRGWVAARCDGDVQVDGNTYFCADSSERVIYLCTTPLVLSFDRQPVSYTTQNATSRFDLSAQGQASAFDWPSAATPWLALDRNHNGRIDDGSELFGSATRLPSGATARHGFEALAALDDDGNGRIDARDASWQALLVWRDSNADRNSQASELTTVTQAGLLSIELGYVDSARCDARGNCERERAGFAWRDATGQVQQGEVVDVHLLEAR